MTTENLIFTKLTYGHAVGAFSQGWSRIWFSDTPSTVGSCKCVFHLVWLNKHFGRKIQSVNISHIFIALDLEASPRSIMYAFKCLFQDYTCLFFEDFHNGHSLFNMGNNCSLETSHETINFAMLKM